MHKEICQSTLFHDLSGPHHYHAIADPCRNSQVVGDENNRELKALLDLLGQREIAFVRFNGVTEVRESACPKPGRLAPDRITREETQSSRFQRAERRCRSDDTCVASA